MQGKCADGVTGSSHSPNGRHQTRAGHVEGPWLRATVIIALCESDDGWQKPTPIYRRGMLQTQSAWSSSTAAAFHAVRTGPSPSSCRDGKSCPQWPNQLEKVSPKTSCRNSLQAAKTRHLRKAGAVEDYKRPQVFFRDIRISSNLSPCA